MPLGKISYPCSAKKSWRKQVDTASEPEVAKAVKKFRKFIKISMHNLR